MDIITHPCPTIIVYFLTQHAYRSALIYLIRDQFFLISGYIDGTGWNMRIYISVTRGVKPIFFRRSSLPWAFKWIIRVWSVSRYRFVPLSVHSALSLWEDEATNCLTSFKHCLNTPKPLENIFKYTFFVIWFKFHNNWFFMVLLCVNQHWFRYWPRAKQETKHVTL